MLSLLPVQGIEEAIHTYGYIAVGIGLLLESIGLPLPGESLLVAAAIYAATTHQLDITTLVLVAAAGAICGDQIGYAIGRLFGAWLLARWGNRVGLTGQRLVLGRHLFRRYGAAIVFGGRFVAVLRTFAAVLAGANRMPWHQFLLWNSLGGACWAGLYGVGAYLLGDAAEHLRGPIGFTLGIVAAAALVAALLYIRKNEAALLTAATGDSDAALPGGPRHL